MVKGDLVFGANGYGGGGVLVKLSADSAAASRPRKSSTSTPASSRTTTAAWPWWAITSTPAAATWPGSPCCINFKTGEIVWKQTKAPEGAGWKKGDQPAEGSAAIVAADGNIILRYQSGEVVMFAASPEGYKQLGMFKPVFQEGTSWAHPVILNGNLYLRENNVLMCYDLKKQ